MARIGTLHTFSTSSPDPTELNQNFEDVKSAFNTSAVITDDPAMQTLSGPLAAEIFGRGGAAGYDPMAYGATGDGVADDAAAIDAAIAAMPATEGGQLRITRKHSVGDGMTIPANVELVFERGGAFVWNGTGSFTLPRPVAGRYPLLSGFAGSASVLSRLQFTGPEIWIYPEWFGAVADGSTNSSLAFRAALRVLGNSGGGRLVLGSGTYICDGTYGSSSNNVDVYSNTVIEGQGADATTLKKPTGSTVSRLFTLAGVDGVTFRDFAVDINSGEEYHEVFECTSAISSMTVQRCRFFDSDTAAVTVHRGDRWVISGSGASFRNLRALDNVVEDYQQLMANVTEVDGAWVERNRIDNAEANAIAFLCAADGSSSDWHELLNIYIRDNIITAPHAAGIFVGPDGTDTFDYVRIRNLHISGNRVDGTWSGNTSYVGISVRWGDDVEGVFIDNNFVDGGDLPNFMGIRTSTDQEGVLGPRYGHGVFLAENRIVNCTYSYRIANVVGGRLSGGEVLRSRGAEIVNCTGFQCDDVRRDGQGVRGGISVAGNSHVTLRGCTSKNGASTAAGLSVAAASGETCTVIVRGGFFGDDQGTPTQGYGILHTGDGTVVYDYEGCDLTGAAAALQNVSAAAGSRLVDCKGIASQPRLAARFMLTVTGHDLTTLASGATQSFGPFQRSGVAPGDLVHAYFSADLQGTVITGRVTGSNNLGITQSNPTASSVNVGMGDLTLLVERYE